MTGSRPEVPTGATFDLFKTSYSAAFKLESPTAASWTGALSVEIPTLGKVLLTAPGTWSTLCEGNACTETPPHGLHFGLLEFN